MASGVFLWDVPKLLYVTWQGLIPFSMDYRREKDLVKISFSKHSKHFPENPEEYHQD